MNLFIVTTFSLILLFVPFAVRATNCAKHCTESIAIGKNSQCNGTDKVILRISDCAFMKENGTEFKFIVGMNGQTEDKSSVAAASSSNANDTHLCCKANHETATLFIIGVANKRLMLAKDVANYKFKNGIPIDDFAREKQLLANVAVQANAAGIGADYGEPFFQDQMDANKMIQKGYVKHWAANKSLRPKKVPNLNTETRPKVTAATEEMILALKVFKSFRKMANCWAEVEKKLEFEVKGSKKRFLSLDEPNGTDAMRKAAVLLCEKVREKAQIDKKAKELLA